MFRIHLKKAEQRCRYVLKTFVCTINIHGNSTTVRGLLDGASDASYVHNAVLLRLGVAEKPTCILNVMSYGSTTSTPQRSACYNATLVNQSSGMKSISVLPTSCITGETQLAPNHTVVSSILPDKHYADPTIFNQKSPIIELLIGSDFYNNFVHLSGYQRLTPLLVLKMSFFGWTPHGSVELPSGQNQAISLTASSSINPV